MRRPPSLLLLIVVVLAMFLWQRHTHGPAGAVSPTGSVVGTASPPSPRSDAMAALPSEARTTLDAIARGGPFEHRQDGVVFGNYEHLLPEQPRGYYHEYTVETPGADTRGARRIITGGTPPVVYYYTDDHYRSFRRFEVAR
jgi:guanyl-specific ribonuclease Sa